MKTLYVQVNEDQIKKSGLIPEPRLSEIFNELNARFITPSVEGIGLVEGLRMDEKRQKLYKVLEHDPNNDYARKDILGDIMTPEEVELVNEQATRAISVINEQDLFDKATKVWYKDYKGKVLTPCDSAVDACELEEYYEHYEAPLWVWGTRQEPIIHINMAHIYSTDNWPDNFEDCAVKDVFDGVEDLEEAVRKFEELNADKVVYYENRRLAVIFNKEVYDETGKHK